MKRHVALLLALALAAAWSPGAHAQEAEPEDNYQIVTHLTLEKALQKIFPGADEVKEQRVSLNAEQAARVQARAGHPLPHTQYLVYIAKKAGKLMGFSVVDEEIGKYRPITSMVGVGPKGKVLGVAIMVYRESRGGEIAHARFLRQFTGKSATDAIRVRKDIISISGATLSVRAVSTQVRKVLAIVEEAFLKGGPAS